MVTIRKTSASRTATVVVLIPVALLLWFAAPYVLPVWRWRNIDFPAIAAKNGIPESELRTVFTMVVRYNPRNSNGPTPDPSPYQIVECTPTWKSVDPLNMKEDNPPLLVRCTLIGEGDGKPLGSLWTDGKELEHYFNIVAWRFPPGSFGLNPTRPVLVYSSIKRADYNTSTPMSERIVTWENDDHFRKRDDHFAP